MTGHTCEGDNETDLKGVGWENMDWIHLVEDRDIWRAHLNMEMGSIRCGEFMCRLRTCYILKKNSAHWS